MEQINFKRLSESVQEQIEILFADFQSSISEREDSRAFGAFIESKIKTNWFNICTNLGYEEVPIPGRRTIFDFAFRTPQTFIGLDIKTKDLDKQRYSDGGVCAVSNLLKYLANDKGVFMIIEFGHNEAKEGSNLRDIEYIRVAPFHTFPADTYRIENLGTGQVRLNYTLQQMWNELDWNRTYHNFFDIFCDLAIKHYERIGRDAEIRKNAILQFKKDGYTYFKFPRG
ncbi:MAG: hypothetical protein HY769_00520 [Candidatus Stahlbacteria bacterium]|nr:hypothetical protein [Candidatus Stahlbacteria bacterium]